VLIADDDATNRKVVEQLLKRLGLPFVSAHNGQQAFDIVASGAAISLILMDLDMPVLDGCMATELIRGLENTAERPRVPILGVSAHAFDEDRQRAIAAGMDDFIAKPFEFGEFGKTIERWLSAQSRPAQ
jgi:CheY-like chemotaxis protein